MTFTTADLWDEKSEELNSRVIALSDFGAVARFSGSMRTVRCFEDNAIVKSILATPSDGEVLVIDGGGSIATALIGDVIARIASDNGWAGVVINGAVRDRAVLSTIPMGIKALASNPRTSAKAGKGEVDVELTFGGVVFTPGLRLYADEDGILVES